ALRADGDHGGGGDLHSRRPAVPGVDVSRLPRAPRRRGRGHAGRRGGAHDGRPAVELRLVRALDPRLVRRTRSVRPLLTVDTSLGVATVVVVLVQATLLARIVARAFDGAPVSALRLDLVVL